MKKWQFFLSVLLLGLASVASANEHVARAMFTTGVSEREPVDQIGQLANDNTKVYFYTEITGMAGKTVTHRWEHGGEVKAEVSFNVGADRWRVWSSKNLQPEWLGEWIVTVIDDAGNTLAEESMAYTPASESTSGGESTEMPATMPAAGMSEGMHDGMTNEGMHEGMPAK